MLDFDGPLLRPVFGAFLVSAAGYTAFNSIDLDKTFIELAANPTHPSIVLLGVIGAALLGGALIWFGFRSTRFAVDWQPVRLSVVVGLLLAGVLFKFGAALRMMYGTVGLLAQGFTICGLTSCVMNVLLRARYEVFMNGLVRSEHDAPVVISAEEKRLKRAVTSLMAERDRLLAELDSDVDHSFRLPGVATIQVFLQMNQQMKDWISTAFVWVWCLGTLILSWGLLPDDSALKQQAIARINSICLGRWIVELSIAPSSAALIAALLSAALMGLAGAVAVKFYKRFA